MPKFGYSYQGYDPLLHVKASLREIDVSPKAIREICYMIRGLSLDKAREILERVKKKESPVPFKRYKKKVPHRKGLVDFYAGKYPVKAAKYMLELLDNLEANAEHKGFDLEKLVIIHACSHRGRKVKNYFPRAFGRASPDFNTLTHVELIAREI
ncbi:MAG: 50S ribosomal protein L22 [Nitrososphaerales archaeon]